VLSEIESQCDLVLVDFHAEMTSEKVAMGWYLDGRATAVFGTHTHVPTADARVLPGGTAFCTDVGMTGSRAGVIGVVKEAAISRMRTGVPARFDSAVGDEHVMGVLVEATRAGRATSVQQLIVPANI
jgi:calcineurin-like phosphoesterase